MRQQLLRHASAPRSKEIDENATTGAITENISITHDGTNSVVIIKDLPTSDPSVAGQIYSNSGVLTVSAG